MQKKSNLLWNTYSIRSTRKSKTPNKTKQTRKAEGKKKEDTVVSSTTHDLFYELILNQKWERESGKLKEEKKLKGQLILLLLVGLFYFIIIS